MRRTWIKLYCDQWLRGSIRQENSEIRSGFSDLLAMAGDSAYGEYGMIQLAKGVGFTDEAIAGILNIPLDEWMRVKKRLSNHPVGKDENRIEIIDVNIGFTIKIINWPHYQSEYLRQKKYRKLQNGLHPELQDELQPGSQRDIEEEIERERDIKLEGVEDIIPPHLDLELNKKEKESLYLLSKIDNYPYDYEKDLKLIRELTIEFPDVDVYEKIKQIKVYWIDTPLKKKSRPRVQIRRWVTNEKKWQEEKRAEKQIGQSQSHFSSIPDGLWQSIARYLYGQGKIEKEVSQFYKKANKRFPSIKKEWEKSDKKSETFIKMIEEMK